jgi:UDP-N-acetylmuramyl pentapeptide synthase
VHREIGRKLASATDIVVLIKNSVTPFIADELAKGGFSEKNIRWFASAPEAHAAIAGIVREGDVVLFQNDWPDNYV